MSTELSGPAGPNEDWPDEDWPAGGPPGPGLPPAPGRGRRLLSFAGLALAALAAGAGLTLAVTRAAAPAPASAPRGGSSLTAPGPASGPGPGAGGVLPPGAVEQLLLIGTVHAISSTSITVDGNGSPVTAAITDATRVTGQVTSVAALRVGDRISAQVMMRNGRSTITAIQYPATAPPGAGPLS
jgi:hypothetical protein